MPIHNSIMYRNIKARENPMGFLVVSGESEFQKEIIIRPDLQLPCKNQY